MLSVWYIKLHYLYYPSSKSPFLKKCQTINNIVMVGILLAGYMETLDLNIETSEWHFVNIQGWIKNWIWFKGLWKDDRAEYIHSLTILAHLQSTVFGNWFWLCTEINSIAKKNRKSKKMEEQCQVISGSAFHIMTHWLALVYIIIKKFVSEYIKFFTMYILCFYARRPHSLMKKPLYDLHSLLENRA